MIEISNKHRGSGNDIKPGEYASLLNSSPEARQELMSAIAKSTRNMYDEYRDEFIRSLSPFNQAVYQQAIKIPYAERDWYRDAHDIVVTWSTSVIVRDENARPEHTPLPEWLITAALLHDRGYGILASQSSLPGSDYVRREGAHWENVDTRVLHSLLSRKFSEGLLFEGNWEDLFPGVQLPLVERVIGFLPPHDRDLFLTVVEKHDHPLIQKLEQLPQVGRHHFDADSLYSVSLSSFVKDYLSYLSDPAKLDKWIAQGLCLPGQALPDTLLGIRLARYYPSVDSLPENWDTNAYPLRPEAAASSEGGRCMEPSSATASDLTAESFILLAQCCRALSYASSIYDFIPWFNHHLAEQFARLEVRVNGERPI